MLPELTISKVCFADHLKGQFVSVLSMANKKQTDTLTGNMLIIRLMSAHSWSQFPVVNKNRLKKTPFYSPLQGGLISRRIVFSVALA